MSAPILYPGPNYSVRTRIQLRRKRRGIAAPLLLFLVVCCSAAAAPLTGFNLIGSDATNAAHAFGPGLSAFETVPAPQGNPNLYQRRLAVVESQQSSGGLLASVSGVFFGSQNIGNQQAPVDLTTLPGDLVCAIWTNGLAGFAARPLLPDFEFATGATTNLVPCGSVTNSATGINYPLYRGRVDLSNAPAFTLDAGGKYAFSLRLRYASVHAVSTRLAQSANTNGLGGTALVLGGGYHGPDTGTNIAAAPLTALAFEFTPVTPPPLTLQLLSATQFRLALPGDPAPFSFLRFESATNLAPPIDWLVIPGFGNPPAATGTLSGSQMFFRSVFQ